jgi:hypothetical protein
MRILPANWHGLAEFRFGTVRVYPPGVFPKSAQIVCLQRVTGIRFLGVRKLLRLLELRGCVNRTIRTGISRFIT